MRIFFLELKMKRDTKSQVRFKKEEEEEGKEIHHRLTKDKPQNISNEKMREMVGAHKERMRSQRVVQ